MAATPKEINKKTTLVDWYFSANVGFVQIEAEVQESA
jgi:hypothetical protein